VADQLGRLDRNYRDKVWQVVYGADANAGVTTVFFTMESLGLSPTTWNPSVPRACRLSGGCIRNQVGSVGTAGDWTLNFYLNDGVVASATATFSATTTKQTEPLNWSTDLLLDPLDSWWIAAVGPSRTTVILRVTLEFELL